MCFVFKCQHNFLMGGLEWEIVWFFFNIQRTIFLTCSFSISKGQFLLPSWSNWAWFSFLLTSTSLLLTSNFYFTACNFF